MVKFLFNGLFEFSRSLIKTGLAEVFECHCTSGMGMEATKFTMPPPMQ